MALFAESEEKIFGEILFSVVNNTNITRSSPGSKTRSLVEATSKKLGKMYRKFDTNIVQAFLDGANGKYLEFIADMMGVSRLGEEPAAVTSAQRIVRFYVDVGTFGDINGGGSITIPSGTVISTGSAGSGISYIVPYTVILSAIESETFIAVESIRTGASQNVGSKQLVNHDFTNYTDSTNNTLKVINDAEITSAKDIESDTNLKFRVANQVLASERANRTSVRIAALSVPGVADVIILPFHRGIGTFELLIKATTATVSDGLIEAVREAVQDVIAEGIVANVRGPKETGFSMVATLTLRRRISASEESGIISAVTANIINYVNSLDIGEEFIVNEAIERVMATSQEIKNVGSATKPFDSLFIYKETKLEDNKIRGTLLGDYDPDVDERLITETEFAGATPILIRIAS